MMQYKVIKSDVTGGWTRVLESKKRIEPIPGVTVSAYGIALLWYQPERRLSYSFWFSRRSWNFRLWGPKLLAWQRTSKKNAKN